MADNVLKPPRMDEMGKPKWARKLSIGHTQIEQINDDGSKDLHWLKPQSKLLVYKLIAVAVAVSLLTPLCTVKSAAAIRNWQMSREQAAQIQAAREAQDRAIRENQLAIQEQQSQMKLREQALAKAETSLAALVKAGATTSSIEGLPTTNVVDSDDFKAFLRDSYWSLRSGKGGVGLTEFDATGKWFGKSVVYRRLDDRTFLVAFLVNDNGAAKTWFAYLQDLGDSDSGQPVNVQSIYNIPGADPSKLYTPSGVLETDFSVVRDAIAATFGEKK